MAVVRMFERAGMITNICNTKSIVCNPGFIRVKQDTVAYKKRVTGEWAMFWERNKTRLSCKDYVGAMAESSLRHKMKRTHRIFLPHTQGVDVSRGGLDIYVVYFPLLLKLVACLLDGYLAQANNSGRLREHFMYWHWKSKVAIIQEGPEPLPQCDHCGMYTLAARLVKHRRMVRYEKAA